jgi:predicted transcriptional regulator
MSLIKYYERIQRIDNLINLRATGTPDEFAELLGIRRSTLFKSLQELRDLNLDIRYSTSRRSYYYADERRIKITIEKFLSKEEIFEKNN